MQSFMSKWPPMSQKMSQLPVESILSELKHTLAASRTVVLQAPPGSGKTTRVPLALLDTAWLGDRRILMLEPRRLAATNAARYMASLKNEQVGDSIGYAIRYERKNSANTRLEVMTEGLLIRRMQSDPELSGVGLVIFDEFHERSLQADLALALCHDIQQGLRVDLHILIMSATLDAGPLSRLLGNCPIITTGGRSFPVAIEHLAEADQFRIAEVTAQGIRHALKETNGDILAFLPGIGEINRCRSMLQDLSTQVALRPLYGGLPFTDQEAAIMPGKQRRIVLSTNVSETSLTIEGIEAVVDSGWERRPRFDASRGMTSLETARISRASAEQRAGRAGRLGPGRCYRMWTEGTQGALLPFAPPEIRQADLTPLAFELSQWGVQDVSSLTWLDEPPSGHLVAARNLLISLGALDEQGSQTAMSRRMARFPTHPRLARLLATAVANDCPGLGSDLVALLSERDLSPGNHHESNSTGPSDLLDRLERLHRDKSSHTGPARRAASYWRKRTKAGHEPSPDPEIVGRLLASAYPDRIGRQRKSGHQRYLLRSGQGAVLSPASVVRDEEWLVAVEIAGRKSGEDEIRLASMLTRAAVEELFGDNLEWQRESGWDDDNNRVVARQVRRLGAITLQERSVTPTVDDILPAIIKLIRHQGLEILPWKRDLRLLQARAALMHQASSEQGWQDWSDTALLDDLENWLAPCLTAVKNRNDLNRIDLGAALKSRLGWKQLKKLDQFVPEKLTVPSGSRIRIDYTDEGLPFLAVKLQEMFGQVETPRLAEGRIPVLIHLLSPAGRPLAVTRDLKSFWDTIYPEVQKEMKGRYPKHPWPDDPWHATATKKTKKR